MKLVFPGILALAVLATSGAKAFDADSFRAKAIEINNKQGLTVSMPYTNQMLITVRVDDTTFASRTGWGSKLATGEELRKQFCREFNLNAVLDGKETFVEIFLESPRNTPVSLRNFLNCE